MTAACGWPSKTDLATQRLSLTRFYSNSPTDRDTLDWIYISRSPTRKDQFTVLILKFGIQDFTDPGLQKIQPTLTGLSL